MWHPELIHQQVRQWFGGPLMQISLEFFVTTDRHDRDHDHAVMTVRESVSSIIQLEGGARVD